jgi:hypothetical protein
MARGLSLCPPEPEKITGTSGRQHGFMMVTTPAKKTINIESSDGCILTFLPVDFFIESETTLYFTYGVNKV